MSLSSIVLDAGGVVREPNLHDATLWGVRLSRQAEGHQDLHVTIEAIGGVLYELRLHRVECMLVEGMWLQNIVYQVHVFREAQLRPAYVARLLRLDHTEMETDAELKRVWLELVAGTLRLVVVEPANGCDVTVVCRDISIERLE